MFFMQIVYIRKGGKIIISSKITILMNFRNFIKHDKANTKALWQGTKRSSATVKLSYWGKQKIKTKNKRIKKSKIKIKEAQNQLSSSVDTDLLCFISEWIGSKILFSLSFPQFSQ